MSQSSLFQNSLSSQKHASFPTNETENETRSQQKDLKSAMLEEHHYPKGKNPKQSDHHRNLQNQTGYDSPYLKKSIHLSSEKIEVETTNSSLMPMGEFFQAIETYRKEWSTNEEDSQISEESQFGCEVIVFITEKEMNFEEKEDNKMEDEDKEIRKEENREGGLELEFEIESTPSISEKFTSNVPQENTMKDFGLEIDQFHNLEQEKKDDVPSKFNPFLSLDSQELYEQADRGFRLLFSMDVSDENNPF